MLVVVNTVVQPTDAWVLIKHEDFKRTKFHDRYEFWVKFPSEQFHIVITRNCGIERRHFSITEMNLMLLQSKWLYLLS